MNDDFNGGVAVLAANPDDRLTRLEEKLDQALTALNRMSRQQEMIGDLKEDLMPMANGIIHLAAERLHEMETEGSLEDFKALGSNALPVIALLKQLSQPEILALGSAAAEGLNTAGAAKPVGLFGAVGALKDPDTKKGMGVLLHLLKSLGKAAR